MQMNNTQSNTPDFIDRIYDDSKSNLEQPFGTKLFCIKSTLKILVKVLEKNLQQSLFLVWFQART